MLSNAEQKECTLAFMTELLRSGRTLYKLYRMKKKGRTSDQKKKRRGKGSCDCYSVQIVQDEKKKAVPAIRRERGGRWVSCDFYSVQVVQDEKKRPDQQSEEEEGKREEVM